MPEKDLTKLCYRTYSIPFHNPKTEDEACCSEEYYVTEASFGDGRLRMKLALNTDNFKYATLATEAHWDLIEDMTKSALVELYLYTENCLIKLDHRQFFADADYDHHY